MLIGRLTDFPDGLIESPAFPRARPVRIQVIQEVKRNINIPNRDMYLSLLVSFPFFGGSYPSVLLI